MGIKKAILNVPFLLSAAVLGIVAAGDGILANYLRVVVVKEPIYLKAPLAQMNRDALGPYKFLGAEQLDPATEEALGTTEYIFWKLVDTRIEDRSNPLRYARLAVTYYTGAPDLAPHTPDVCLAASGYTPKQAHENSSLTIDSLAEGNREVPIRVLTFMKSAIFSKEEPSVIYTFHCNGQFFGTAREMTRALNLPTSRHAYYAKVEITFGDGSSQPRHASREQTLTAGKDLLEVVLPMLLRDHLPDWRAAEGQV